MDTYILYNIIVILIALISLTLMAFKGIPILLAALTASFAFLILTDPTNILSGFKDLFMNGTASYVTKYFILFLLGSLFGTMVEHSGAADSIARNIIKVFGDRFVVVGVMIVTAILTFGGVSVFVALFAVYPLAMTLFKKADVPRRLFAAAYLAGGGTFTMTAPFTPAVQNIIPTEYLGTTVGAAPIAGSIGAIFGFVFCTIYLYKRQQQVKAAGEHFLPLETAITSDLELNIDAKEEKSPSLIVALLPMIILLVTLNIVKLPVESSLFVAFISAVILYFPYYPHDIKFMISKLGNGCSNATTVIINTAVTVGFGTVIASSAAFEALIPIVTNLPGNPLVAAGIATTILAGMTGSSSGGLAIAIPIISKIYLPLGVNPAALHRVASVACSGLDSLPHCGFIVTTLNYSKTTHKDGYKDMFVVSVVMTLIQLAIVLLLTTNGII